MANILLVLITIILAALVLLMIPELDFYQPEDEPPVIFEIMVIYSEEPDYDSRIILRNTGINMYENRLLSAEIHLSRGDKVCQVETFNGHDFIPTHHFGVQTMGGSGCCDNYWCTREKIALDLSDKSIRTGDVVEIEFYSGESTDVISRDTYTLN
ncbi:hypothetical protein [Methanoplanus endosymbiosus]|uniref:Archaeal Type IV pilin N-terminal domain-containing protein n=1 Tax=Methanoplanus endosymbiosus TaxID=33865 RepID=A0A9E7TKS6_9EURY|nr:hypothetical protein [Methanoplanus endosymbiosus]UUX92940.1 hypothetical protein L6E24_02090 [Methanoplanus endosymbiosus]